MSSNRLVRAQLLRKLSDLKKSVNYPVRPNSHPAILYVESVLKPENLTWAPPQRRGANLNTTIQKAIRGWPGMDKTIRGWRGCNTLGSAMIFRTVRERSGGVDQEI